MSRRDEYLNAGVWAALGMVILVASWRMDRLATMNIDPWSVPGLTPGVVGVLMIVLALALALQARRAGKDQGLEEADPADGGTLRTLGAMVLCVLFAGITLGRGLPFAVEGAVFIVAFTAVFSWRTWRDENRIARGLAQTIAVAVIAAALISWLFESVFLVRLP
ncbi:MAG: tripartite tricarboxylate transporter TctB family protein [Rubrivivax sp.]